MLTLFLFIGYQHSAHISCSEWAALSSCQCWQDSPIPHNTKTQKYNIKFYLPLKPEES